MKKLKFSTNQQVRRGIWCSPTKKSVEGSNWPSLKDKDSTFRKKISLQISNLSLRLTITGKMQRVKHYTQLPTGKMITGLVRASQLLGFSPTAEGAFFIVKTISWQFGGAFCGVRRQRFLLAWFVLQYARHTLSHASCMSCFGFISVDIYCETTRKEILSKNTELPTLSRSF